LDNYVLKTKAALLGPEGMRIRTLVRAQLEGREHEQGMDSLRKEIETIEPERQAALTRVVELKESNATPKKREESLKELWRLEDRIQELKNQRSAKAWRWIERT
jgi:pyruvate-formate lyase-activating enzyme